MVLPTEIDVLGSVCWLAGSKFTFQQVLHVNSSNHLVNILDDQMDTAPIDALSTHIANLVALRLLRLSTSPIITLHYSHCLCVRK